MGKNKRNTKIELFPLNIPIIPDISLLDFLF